MDEFGEGEKVSLVEGGYKVLEESVAMFREVEIFADYFAEQSALQKGQQQQPELQQQQVEKDTQSAHETKKPIRGANKPFRAGCITRQLRAVEMFALSPAGLAAPKIVKSVLKRLNQPITPLGARQVLLELGHQSKFAVSKLRFPTQAAASEAGKDSGSVGEVRSFH